MSTLGVKIFFEYYANKTLQYFAFRQHIDTRQINTRTDDTQTNLIDALVERVAAAHRRRLELLLLLLC
jgi:hypothetical protein